MRRETNNSHVKVISTGSVFIPLKLMNTVEPDQALHMYRLHEQLLLLILQNHFISTCSACSEK